MNGPSDIVMGANAGRSRSHNRQVVLARVRAAGAIGRAEIARASGLSTQAVSNIIADLIADDLIVERGHRAGARGLPVAQYALNPAGGVAAGLEIRPDAVVGTLMDLGGSRLASLRRELPAPDRDTVTDTVRALRAELLATSRTRADRVLGTGLVMPGPFAPTGLRGSASDLPLWDEIPPERWFADALGGPVLVENDANAAAIAERVCGVAQGLDSYAFVYFGAGLGLGIVQEGRLLTGAHGNAGEIGHIPVPAAGGALPLEDAVSRLSVQRALEAQGLRVGSVDDLAALHRAGHPALADWLDAATGPLTAAIAIVENLFDPETVILGGAMPDGILDQLVAAVRLPERSVSARPGRTVPRLMRGASGRMTATLGAAALVVNQLFTPGLAVRGEAPR